MNSLLSSPPTDNLYKFMAIFGLVLIIVPITSLTMLIFSVKYDVASVESHIAQLVLESASISNERREAMLEAYDNQFYAIERERTQVAEKVRDIYVLLWIEGVLCLIGAFVSSLGFILWYHRTQRIHDRMLLQKCIKLLTSASSVK